MKLLLALALVLGLSGCGAGSKACAVIDIAKAACDVLPLRYLGPDGKPHIVHVRRDEINAFGHTVALKRAAEGK